MNKHRYCLIFSRARKEPRVPGCIHERGQAGDTGVPRRLMTIGRLVRLLALFASPAVADGIVADGAAAPGQRPQVTVTRNGLPQVNITAPNQAGLSHNQYQQFDVDRKGIVLNNSATTTSTRLAGTIQGNPNLNPVPAKVILNEVNGNNPSQLRGLMEVAGRRAQVIVANPAGIVCNGCGTINAGRMTLTTAKPQLNADGGLAGYPVERGVVRIEGDGLNGDERHDTEYVDVLARAVEVNAGIWAKKELNVVAGRNHVSADGKRVIAQAADGKAPDLAIDMGQMGGMYSDHIRMIGTDAGVGVRNQGGRLQAGKTLSVGSEGKLVWQSAAQEGVTQAGGNISLAARDDIEHRGKLHGGGRLSVESRTGELKQSGTLAAVGDVRLKSDRGIHSRGHLLAGSDANGRLIHAADLTVTSKEDIRVSGSLLSNKQVSLSGRRVDISQSQLAADRATISARSGGVALRQAKVDSRELAINTAGDVDVQQAQITASQWNITAGRLFNQKAIWYQRGSGKSRFTLNGALDNSDGELGSNGDLTLDVGSLDNQDGSVNSRLALNLAVGGDIHNAHGELLAGNQLTINAGGALNNESGTINGGQLQMVTQYVNNVQGQLIGQGDLTLDVGSLDNPRGLVAAGEAMSIRTEGEVNNRGGTIQGGKTTTLVARAIDNDEGRLLSGQRLMLSASGVADNHSGAISGERLELAVRRLGNLLGKIIARQGLNLSAKQALDNTEGLLEAGGVLAVRTDGDWDNRGGSAQGGTQVNASARRFDNAGGRLQSGGELILNSTGDVSNQRGKVTAQQDLNWRGGTASWLDNDGGSLQSAGDLSLQGGRLTNRQRGVVLSQQALALQLAGHWDNQGGMFTGKGRTTVRTAGLHNAQGAVNALDSLDMQFTETLDNDSGRIFSKRSQSLQAQHIFNTQGRIDSQGSWGAVSDDINNREGLIQSQYDATIAATVLDNAKGVVQSAAGLDLRVMSDTDNRSGKLSATGPLNLQGPIGKTFSVNLNNVGGQLLSGDTLTVAARRADNQRGGLFYSQKEMRLGLIQVLDNRQGKVQSGGGLQLDAQSLLNAGGALDSRQQIELRMTELLDNDGGAVRSNGDQQIAARQVANRRGVFSSHGGLSLTAAQLDNAGGTLTSNGVGVYRTETLNNQQGKVHSGDTLTLNATWLNNRAGQLVSTRMFALKAARFDNSGQGTVSSQAGFEIQADRLNNSDGGILLGTTHGGVTAREVDNSAGRLQSAGSLTFSGLATLDNRQGRILANGDLRINSDAVRAGSVLALLNQGGLVQSGETLTLNTRALDNQGGTLQSQRSLTLAVQQDYTHRAGDTLSSNGAVSLSVAGMLTNLADWLLPGSLTVNSHHLTHQGSLVVQALQLTTGKLFNKGHLEADRMMLDIDTLDNRATVIGDNITVRGRVIDNHGRDALIAASEELHLQTADRLTNRDGVLLYSGGGLHLGSSDLIENRGSFIEADGDITLEAHRLDSLRGAEKSDEKWQRYNNYLRSRGLAINADRSNMAPTTRQLTFRDDAAAQNDRYGTLLAIDANSKRARVRVKDNRGQLTDLWVNYLALMPNADGGYAITFYEMRGWGQNVPTPWHNTFRREHDIGRID